MPNEFELDLLQIRHLILNDDFARKLYCSLENQAWRKGEDVYTCSFRYAGGLVAEIRDQGECYMDFYCCWTDPEYESCTVYPEVEQALNSIGWFVCEYPE